MGNVLPDRSVNATLAFPELDAPVSFSSVSVVAHVVACIFTVAYAAGVAWFVYLLWRSSTTNMAERQRVATRRLRLMLLGNMCSCLGLFAYQGFSLGAMSPEECTYRGAMYAPFYLLSNFFVYQCLLERARVSIFVSGSPKHTRLKRLFMVAQLGVLSVPGIAVLSFVLFNGTLYFREQICVQNVRPWIAWVAGTADTSLNVLLLYLFLAPVLGLLRERGKNTTATGASVGGRAAEPARKLRHKSLLLRLVVADLAHRNLVLTLIAATTTFVYITTVATVSQYLKDNETPEVSWMRMVQAVGIAIVMPVNTSCVLTMASTVWMPARLASCVNHCFTSARVQQEELSLARGDGSALSAASAMSSLA
jgi:hypothetical protein